MADVDMKQKIKEVRDKFLSNNQIEDIRQNITLGVEERLKFLNAEQIKVVELLEEKHKELNNELQIHSETIQEDKKNFEELLNTKTSSLELKVNGQAQNLEDQTKKLSNEVAHSEAELKKTFQSIQNEQAKSFNSKISDLFKNITKLKEEITKIESNILEKIEETNSKISVSEEKFSTHIKVNSEKLENLLTEKNEKTINSVDEKLSVYEKDKKVFLQDSSEKFEKTLSELDTKIESFIKNHETVEQIIDGRLEEFRSAQKAAFEELEAALTLLERHQDETINRFKNKSEFGINNHINIPNASSKNRGSILHQPKDQLSDIITTVHAEIPEDVENKKVKSRIGIKLPFLLILFFSMIIIVGTKYFEIDYHKISEMITEFRQN